MGSAILSIEKKNLTSLFHLARALLPKRDTSYMTLKQRTAGHKNAMNPRV